MTFRELLFKRWSAAQEYEQASNVVRELQHAGIRPAEPDYQRLSTARDRWDSINNEWRKWNR